MNATDTDTAHITTVGPVNRADGVSAAGSPPAYAYRCTCGAHGRDKVAVSTTPRHRREARGAAVAEAQAHRREAMARGARA